MDYITKNDASFVKTSLIDFWLKNYTADLIANEVPFFKGNRRADLIMISNNNLLGFEIKSDFVYVVIDKKFKFSKELAELPSQIGILVYDKEIMIKREAKKIKKFKKNDLILLLWRKDLEMLLNSKKLDLDQLQKNAQNILTVDKIKAQILTSLNNRYGAKYKYFLLDRGNYTTIEDLRTITRINSQMLLF